MLIKKYGYTLVTAKGEKLEIAMVESRSTSLFISFCRAFDASWRGRVRVPAQGVRAPAVQKRLAPRHCLGPREAKARVSSHQTFQEANKRVVTSPLRSLPVVG